MRSRGDLAFKSGFVLPDQFNEVCGEFVYVGVSLADVVFWRWCEGDAGIFECVFCTADCDNIAVVSEGVVNEMVKTWRHDQGIGALSVAGDDDHSGPCFFVEIGKGFVGVDGEAMPSPDWSGRQCHHGDGQTGVA